MAALTVEAKGVEEALLALSCPWVTVAWPGDVDVAAAVTWLALAAWHLRVAIVVVGTDITTRPSIARLTFTHHILGPRVEGATRSKAVARVISSRTRARATRYAHLQPGVTVEALDTHSTVGAGGVAATLMTYAGVGVAGVSVAVTLTPLTVGEVPEAWLAL